MTIVPEFERQLFAIAEEVLPVAADREPRLELRPGNRSGSRTGRFRRRDRLVAGLAMLAAVGGVAGAAAASGVFSAASGIHVRGGDPNARALGTGEALRMGAADAVTVGERFTRDIPFAPGYEAWRAGTIAFEMTLVGNSPPPGHAYMTSGALRFQVAESAACSWLDYYVSSAAVGNTTAAAAAAREVTAAPHWPAILGLSYPDQLGSAIAAVHAGDGKLVQAVIDDGLAGDCTAFGPFPPAGMSHAQQRARLTAAHNRGQREIATDPVARRLGIR
jgi:hypothetical protein